MPPLPYATLEAAGGMPLELYRFVVGTTVFTYTSGDIAVVFNAGAGDETYTPSVVKRGAIQASSETPKLQLPVAVSADSPFAALFVNGAAPSAVRAAVYRFQRGADLSGGLTSNQIVTAYSGVVAASLWQGGEAQVMITPSQRTVQQTIPQFRLQVPCNHALYDGGCTVVKASFTLAATVSGIDLTGTVIGLTFSAAALAVPYYSTGLLNFGSFSGFIETHDNSTALVATVSLLVPISGLIVGSAVTVSAGCDRTFPTCTNKFSNTAKHFGFPYVVSSDPWLNGIRIDGQN